MYHGMELVGIVSWNGQYHSIVEVLDDLPYVIHAADKLALPQRDSSLLKVHLFFCFSVMHRLCSN